MGVVLGNNGVGVVLDHSLFPGHLAICTHYMLCRSANVINQKPYNIVLMCKKRCNVQM